jgi:hypothetical protein
LQFEYSSIKVLVFIITLWESWCYLHFFVGKQALKGQIDDLPKTILPGKDEAWIWASVLTLKAVLLKAYHMASVLSFQCEPS